VAAVFAYRSDPAVARWLSSRAADLGDLGEELVGAGTQLVIERDGTVVGDLTLRVTDAWSQREVADQARGATAEIGWVLAPEHQGQGYAGEAVRELVTCAFEMGVRRVQALCFADNAATLNVMEQVGLRLEGHYVRESLHRDGTWRDGRSYALLADEWDRGRNAPR
jgi:RimJ/RimL family protein N-acetyltransferase